LALKAQVFLSVFRLLKVMFEWFGGLGIFFARLLRTAFVRPMEWSEIVRQCDLIGSLSLPLVALAGAASGVVLELETHDALTQYGAGSMLPSVIVFALIRETGPIIAGLMVAARVGAGVSAQLGSMRVTEQIDAMQVSAIDPYKFLAFTRVLACILMLPLLTVAADFFGIFFGWLAYTLSSHVSLSLFLDRGFRTVGFSDFIPATLRTCVFGFIIGLVACFQGMRTSGGTEGVGRATTSSVVLASLFVILADVVLVRLILLIWPL
jgi:phospholipid/cholesterol/gamma-HCH transport system permease protein